MEKITRQNLADVAAERWRKQYPEGKTWPDKDAIYEKLAAMPKGAPPDAIDAAIGNGSWTNLNCDECGAENVEFVVRVGEPLDYESSTADLCGACIETLKSTF